MDPFMIEAAGSLLIIILVALLIMASRRTGKLEAEIKRIPLVETELETERNQVRHYLDVARALENDLGRKSGSVDELNKIVTEKNKRIEVLEATLRGNEETWRNLEAENAGLREARDNDQRRIEELKDVQQKFEQAFAGISKRALSENRQDFLDLAKEALSKYQTEAKGDLEKKQQAIGELLAPLKENLDKLDLHNREIERTRQDAYSTLTQQVRSLQQDTSNLVLALRAPSTRGRWGELQLQRCVELAGMIEHVHFEKQVSIDTEEGRQRPDMIIKLPGSKNVVVDAKVPLTEANAAFESGDDAVRRSRLLNHARLVRDHITKLSRKSYWEQFEPTPEFVVLFLPGESFLYAALEVDPSLIEDGIGDRVILATPTTLIAMLKAIAYGWRQEVIAGDARQISDLGAELYKRLVKVGEHFESIGTHLGRTVKSYNDSISSIERNVLSTARKLKDHSIQTGDKDVAELEQIELNVRSFEKNELKTLDSLAAGGQPSLLE